MKLTSCVLDIMPLTHIFQSFSVLSLRVWNWELIIHPQISGLIDFFLVVVLLEIKINYTLFILEHTRLSAWIQSGEAHIKELLKYVITKDSVNHCLVVICVDISKPWNMVDNLDHYLNVVREHLHTLNLSAKTLNEMERKGKQEGWLVIHSRWIFFGILFFLLFFLL